MKRIISIWRRWVRQARWMREYEQGLNRRAEVEQKLWLAAGGGPLPDREKCREWDSAVPGRSTV